MIYYKRKSWIKKIFKRRREFNLSSFKIALSALSILFIFLYSIYLFCIPYFLNEKNVEQFANNYLSQYSKFILDIDNLKIRPDYKFDIALSADYIKLKYSKDKDFLSIEKPRVEINLLTLFLGYVDLNKIKSSKITIDTTFTKNKKYSCFNYFDFNIFDLKSHNLKLQLRNVRILADKFNFNLYDENVNKYYYIEATNPKLNLSDINKPFYLATGGVIKTKSHKISDFNLNLELLLNQNEINQFREKITNLNFNPFLYADKFNFYTKSDINLKFNSDKTTGKIAFLDYSFDVDNIKLPKNNLIINLKGNSANTDCNFNFFNNQYIKIKSSFNFNKNKKAQIYLNSSDIDLAQLKRVVSAFYKIMNFKLDLDDIDITGTMKADVNLKSDFKTIVSDGALSIKNAKLTHKKLNLILDNISSNVNFENNKILISNTKAYINDAKFYLEGNIDNNTNLNLKMNSDLMNIAQVLKLIQSLPLISKLIPSLDDYQFNKGYLKVSADIKGNLNNPVINTNSILKDLKVYLKKNNIDFSSSEVQIFAKPKDNTLCDISFILFNSIAKYDKYILKIPKISATIVNNDIKIAKTPFNIDNSKGEFEGIIKNYKQNQSLNLTLNSQIPYYLEHAQMIANVIIEPEKLIINSCNIFDKNKKIAFIFGEIKNYASKNPYFNNLKIQIDNKTSFNIEKYLKFDIDGNLSISGNLNNPNLNGNLTLYNIQKDYLYIKELILNIKNSTASINIDNAKYQDSSFSFTANAKYQNKKLVLDSANISIQYINLSKIQNLINNKLPLAIEITDIKGNINTLEIEDILVNLIKFSASFKDNILNVSNFTSEIFAGYAGGTIKYDLNSNIVAAGIILKNLDVRLLSKQLKQYSIAASGRLNALIDADFKGFDYNTILRTLDGYIKFDIKNGELSQFAKLERFLQAGNILSQSILKLSLNSVVSTVSNKNTGDFEKIEGIIRIQNAIAQIQHIKTQGTNMSLYLDGNLNLLTMFCNVKIFGRIPQNIVNVLGEVGKFSTNRLVDKMSKDAKDIIKSLTVSPIEKMLSDYISQEDVDKIPALSHQTSQTQTREFKVIIQGLVNSANSVKTFKWRATSEI